MQIFTLVTGVIYIILEIRQKNLMWVVGIATSLAAMWVFFRQGLYASFGLNTYYLITAFIGLWQWGKDRQRLGESASRKSKSKKKSTPNEVLFFLEAPSRFELEHKGFADLCLTAWLWRHMERITGLEPATSTLARSRSTK